MKKPTVGRTYRRTYKTTLFKEPQGLGISRMNEYVEISIEEDGTIKMTFGHFFFDDRNGKKPSRNGGCAHAAYYSRHELRTMMRMLKKIL